MVVSMVLSFIRGGSSGSAAKAATEDDSLEPLPAKQS